MKLLELRRLILGCLASSPLVWRADQPQLMIAVYEVPPNRFLKYAFIKLLPQSLTVLINAEYGKWVTAVQAM